MSQGMTSHSGIAHQKLLFVFSCASGAAIMLAFAILVIGIFIGPIWLIALSVFVGCCSVLCIAYILTSRYKFTNSLHQGDERSSTDINRVRVGRGGHRRSAGGVSHNMNGLNGSNNLDDLVFGAPFCIYDMKLPTYEETIQSSRIQPPRGILLSLLIPRAFPNNTIKQ